MCARSTATLSITSQTDLIETTLDQIYQVFLKAFSEGKTEVHDAEFHKVAVFNSLWRRLHKQVSSFSTIAELNLYYQQQSENLNVEINAYCTSHRDVKISPNKRELCRYLIKVYHLLIRQQYYFHKLSEMTKQINVFNKHCQREIEGLKGIDVTHIKNKVKQIDLVLLELVKALDQNSEIKSKYTFFSGQPTDENKLLAPVMAQLKRLPSFKMTNNIMPRARDAARAGDEVTLTQLQQMAKAAALVSHDIYNHLQQLLSDYQRANAVIIAKWKNNDEFVTAFMDSEKSISSTSDLLTNLVRDMQNIVSTSAVGVAKNAFDEIKLAGDNLVTLCKNQSAATKMPTIIWDNGWKDAMSKTASLLTVTAEKLEKFVQAYNDPPDLSDLRTNIKSLLQRQHESEECRQLLSDESDKIEAIWTNCSSRLLEVTELDTKVGKLKANPVKHFMRQHWWKMLLGSVIVGAVVATTITLLLFPPIIIGVAVAVSIIAGALLGVGAGIMTDLFCKPTLPDLSLSDAEHMLKKPGRRSTTLKLIDDSPSLDQNSDDKTIPMTTFKDKSGEVTSIEPYRLFTTKKAAKQNSDEVELLPTKKLT